ncbi:MAG: DUF805 domain-containing protein [Flavobacteriaceae bacterium]|nr:DUF805 domain-containing protein [Flavobacteriaceae bacterium]
MFKNPFSFEGRIRRTEFGLSMIIWAVVHLGLVLIAQVPIGAAIALIGWVFAVWFNLAQSVKRSHDIGNSGWYILFPLYGFWLLFAEGDKGPNQYGADPKDEGNNGHHNHGGYGNYPNNGNSYYGGSNNGGNHNRNSGEYGGGNPYGKR